MILVKASSGSRRGDTYTSSSSFVGLKPVLLCNVHSYAIYVLLVTDPILSGSTRDPLPLLLLLPLSFTSDFTPAQPLTPARPLTRSASCTLGLWPRLMTQKPPPPNPPIRKCFPPQSPTFTPNQKPMLSLSLPLGRLIHGSIR
jgi:hypothetical protein